jgi:hypothetical protein
VSNPLKAGRMKGNTVSSVVVLISAAGWSWTSGDLAAAWRATVTARTGGVMFTYDGSTDPSATLGHLLPKDGTVVIEGNANVQALRFIREASTDASVTVTLET